MRIVRLLVCLWVVPVVVLNGCSRQGPPPPVVESSSARDAAAPSPSNPRESGSGRDLSVDESMGGHTLARHVGKTDAELSSRLRRERQISSASTYTDRETADRAVGAAVAASHAKITAWERRNGRRPNLVLHYIDRSR
jgi:hypothetical protein